MHEMSIASIKKVRQYSEEYFDSYALSMMNGHRSVSYANNACPTNQLKPGRL